MQSRIQRSQSFHVDLSVDEPIALKSTASSTTGVLQTKSTHKAISKASSSHSIVDVPKSLSLEKTKRKSKFGRASYIHAIPFVIPLCFFCLWLASSGWGSKRIRQFLNFAPRHPSGSHW